MIPEEVLAAGRSPMALGFLGAGGRIHQVWCWDLTGDPVTLYASGAVQETLPGAKVSFLISMPDGRSFQLLGRCRAVQAVGPEDRTRFDGLRDGRVGALHDAGMPTSDLIGAMVGTPTAVLKVEVGTVLDEMPGPSAGRVLVERTGDS